MRVRPSADVYGKIKKFQVKIYPSKTKNERHFGNYSLCERQRTKATAAHSASRKVCVAIIVVFCAVAVDVFVFASVECTGNGWSCCAVKISVKINSTLNSSESAPANKADAFECTHLD